MWPFKSTDPLIKRLLDDYNLNLLSPPKEKYLVGDVCMKSGDMVQRIGSITDFLIPPLELPQVQNETVADISGQVSGSTDASIGLDFFAGFLNLMGAGGIINKIKNTFDKKSNATMKFRFPQTIRDFIDPIVFAKSVVGHKFDEKNPIYKKKNQYYVAAGVFRTPSISLISDADVIKNLNSNVGGDTIANISINVSSQNTNESEITFSDKEKKLAYGVQLFELGSDKEGNWSLGNSGYFKVRGLAAGGRNFRPPVYATMNYKDDIFVNISD